MIKVRNIIIFLNSLRKLVSKILGFYYQTFLELMGFIEQDYI